MWVLGANRARYMYRDLHTALRDHTSSTHQSRPKPHPLVTITVVIVVIGVLLVSLVAVAREDVVKPVHANRLPAIPAERPGNARIIGPHANLPVRSVASIT